MIELEDAGHPTRHWSVLPDGRVQCDVCPRHCRLGEGQRGLCFVRGRQGGEVRLLTYGRSSGYCVDPIEKKPLNHFLPGTPVLSFGTAGCNLACRFCFPRDTWIATSRGLRRIGELFEECREKAPLAEGRVGFPERLAVWTREGERASVSKIFARPHQGELVSLKGACCPPILATPDHGIFAAHRSDPGTIRKLPARELTTDHYLVVAKRQPGRREVSISTRDWLARLPVPVHAPRARRVDTHRLGELLRLEATSGQLAQTLGDHPAYLRELRGQLSRGVLRVTEAHRPLAPVARDGRVRFPGERGQGIPERLSLTADLAWLLGVFCAEGAILAHAKRPNSYQVSFCFGHRERELVSRTAHLLASLFDARPVIVDRRTTTTVECRQTSVARLFEALCGRGARRKQVPAPVRDAPEPVIRAFLDGYLMGDGHRTATHVVALTVSERLALGLFELGLHLGLLPTYFEHTPPPTKRIEGRAVSQSKLYVVKFLRKRFDPCAVSPRERARWRETERSFLVPLRRIERVPYRGEVYNLEVDDPDHSYLAPFVAVANCQNWDISKSRDVDRLSDQAPPERVARAARALGCRSVAFTYNDPVVFLEYAIDTAIACRELGVRSVAVTAGYVCPEPRVELFTHMDAANVDLKAFTRGFYKKVCGGELEAVLETLCYLRKETQVWLEVTTLLIPGENDSEAELHAAALWFAEQLGPSVPWHFTAFHPDYRMLDKQSTPGATLSRARRIALGYGLHYVYTGNVHDEAGGSTYCHACGERIIGRDWYVLKDWKLDAEGRCASCGAACAGVFEPRPGSWGSRRMPVRLADCA